MPDSHFRGLFCAAKGFRIDGLIFFVASRYKVSLHIAVFG
jgi:hypothetical protein